MFYPAWHDTFSLFQTAAIIPVPLAICEHVCWREPLSLWVAVVSGSSVTFKRTGEGLSWQDKPMPPDKLRPQFLLQQPAGLPSSPQFLGTAWCTLPSLWAPSPWGISPSSSLKVCALCKRCSGTGILMENHQLNLKPATLMQILINGIINELLLQILVLLSFFSWAIHNAITKLNHCCKVGNWTATWIVLEALVLVWVFF